MADAATIQVDIVSAEGELFSGAASEVIAPASQGDLGILPRHAPLLTTLAVGELRVRQRGVDESFYVGGGFLEVNANVITVLADDAERAANIDEAHAQEARRRAQALLEERGTDVDQATVAAELERAVGRIRVAELHRRRGGRTRPVEQRGEDLGG